MKLGFYIENTTVPGLREAIRLVKPKVVLMHLNDRSFAAELRQMLPDAFIVGRVWFDPSQQERWLRSPNPEGAGEEMANIVLNWDYGIAQLIVNGKGVFDALMGMNEPMAAPSDGRATDKEWLWMANNLDIIQAVFQTKLKQRGLEAVAFNFGAGNYSLPWHYLGDGEQWKGFQRTFATHTYLGFHEYGWPRLRPAPDTLSAAMQGMNCIGPIRAKYGKPYKGIVTELGLTSMYGHPTWPDKGWLQDPPPPIPGPSFNQYFSDLAWYNDMLCKDANMIGACLFEVGHAGKWESMRFIGTGMLEMIAELAPCAPPVVVTPPPPQPEKPPVPQPERIVPRLRPPFDGPFPISQKFGARPDYYRTLNRSLTKGHEGLDIGMRLAPVKAAYKGTVWKVVTVAGDKKKNPYGIHVRIAHEANDGYRFETVYAHLDSASVSVGDEVEMGQQIGLSGNSGNSDGYHLHFGVRWIARDNTGLYRDNGSLGFIDPEPLLDPALRLPEKPQNIVAAMQMLRVQYAMLGNAIDRLDQEFSEE